MVATFPAFDTTRGLLLASTDGLPVAQPCGDCPEWSIYVVCWRSGGCGITPCEVDVYLYKDYSAVYTRADCGIHKFIYTATRLNQLVWGPFASPLTGTVSVEFTIDGVGVAGPSSQSVVETIPCSDSYSWPDLSYFASGWHSCKAFVTWTGTKEGVGATTIREMYAACVYAVIRPSGEDAIALHDVIILPGSGTEVCIDETLRAVKMLGPYRHYDDADYVLDTFATTIQSWAEKCLCPNTCVGAEKYGSWGDDDPLPGGTNDLTDGAVAYGNQDWLSCTPMDIPIYVDLHFLWNDDPNEDLAAYIRFYSYNPETDDFDIPEDEITLGMEYDDTFIVPPCMMAKFIIENSGDEYTDGLNFEFTSNYANAPLPTPPEDVETESECPYEDDITDMVPFDAASLIEYLQGLE